MLVCLFFFPMQITQPGWVLCQQNFLFVLNSKFKKKKKKGIFTFTVVKLTTRWRHDKLKRRKKKMKTFERGKKG